MEKIDNILNEKPDPLTTVILLSALYFKGEWNQHFIESMTQRYMILPFIISTDDVKKQSNFYSLGDYKIFLLQETIFYRAK